MYWTGLSIRVITKARRRFLGLWKRSQSLSLAKSSIFFVRRSRVTRSPPSLSPVICVLPWYQHQKHTSGKTATQMQVLLGSSIYIYISKTSQAYNGLKWISPRINIWKSFLFSFKRAKIYIENHLMHLKFGTLNHAFITSKTIFMIKIRNVLLVADVVLFWIT